MATVVPSVYICAKHQRIYDSKGTNQTFYHRCNHVVFDDGCNVWHRLTLLHRRDLSQMSNNS